MTKRRLKLVLQINLVLFLLLIPAFQRVNAQWPPFSFALTPRFENDRITYSMRFASKVDWAMRNVIFKISVPEGTRFLEASALPTTRVDFDGEEVTFFTSDFQHPIRDAFFVVEVLDPTKTVYTTQAWIAWEGDQPGDYLTEEVAIDITRQPLNWSRPLPSDLQLDVKAIAADDIITYEIYPENVTRRRIWDLKIKVPIPEGTDLLQVEAPPAFATNFDGKEVTFSIVELERETEYPLSFQISTDGTTSPFVATRAWVVWKNVGRNVGQSIPLEDQTVTGDIIVQPHVAEQVVPDAIGDVPFSNYDIISISLQEDGADLRINFYTAGEVGPTSVPVESFLFIDADCNADSGNTQIRGLGAEYVVQYKHSERMADLKSWDPDRESWRRESVVIDSLASGRMVVVWVPYNLLDSDQQFCWKARTRNSIKGFDPNPPADWVPNSDRQRITQYESKGLVVQSVISQETTYQELPSLSSSSEPVLEEAYLIQVGENWRYLKGYGEASYPIMAWQQVGYDDTGWQVGPTGFGYGDGDDTTILDDMRSNYLSVFMRHGFDVSDPNEAKSLTLEIDYDDGFVAYLNGTEVVRRNVDSTDDAILFNTQAASGHEAGRVEVIDLSSFINLLVPGENVLAIQGHNDHKDSADFSIIPALRWEYTAQPAASPEPSATELSITTNFINANGRVVPPIYYGNDVSTTISPTVYTDTTISGKLAVPIDIGQDHYDLHVFSLPDGREIVKIANARQPNFRFDGQRMLINREGGGVENIFEYDFTDGTENQVSDAPRDSHPFYDPWGNRVTYGNSELTVGADGLRHPYIFVQCGLLPPHQEQERRCRDIPQFGILVPAGQMGEIRGAHPVWTATDMIAYKGCNSWAGFATCGIYIVPSSSTKGFSNGFIPRRLTKYTSDIPSDTKDDLIVFTSRRDGNWEAYVMSLNGAGVKNLSNSPTSNDGLPTISPDGDWIAFVSDREGQWAVWVAPVAGGLARKLFDLPVNTPWGEGDRTWTNERISWGP